MIEERTGIITFQGNPLTLIGKGVSVGEAAPEFCVLANDLTPRTLADYKGKVLSSAWFLPSTRPSATCRPAVSTPKPPSFPTTSAS